MLDFGATVWVFQSVIDCTCCSSFAEARYFTAEAHSREGPLTSWPMRTSAVGTGFLTAL